MSIFFKKFLQLGAELQVLEPSELSDALVLEKLRGTRVESDGTVPYASGTSSSTSSSAPVPSEVKATAPGLKKPGQLVCSPLKHRLLCQ